MQRHLPHGLLSMTRFLFVALFAACVLVRVPSLAEPAGVDQGLYAYVGQQILQGNWPYRDAWDQKPPAIHAAYAALFAVWAHPSVVAVADLVLTVLTAGVLLQLGRRLDPTRGAGETTALLFLFLANPAFGRLGGVRVRGQCEVFIGLAVAAAFLVLRRSIVRAREPWSPPGDDRVFRSAGGGKSDAGTLSRTGVLAAGCLLGVAALFKYNAIVYGLPAVVALTLWPNTTWEGRLRGLGRIGPWLILGILVPVVTLIAWFGFAGVLPDLFQATIAYNLRYSGETYAGALDFLRHLVVFPVNHARIDSLWWLGGLGSAVLVFWAWLRPTMIVIPLWVAAACLSIAINGSRGLPQYFVQAWPPLSLAAGLVLAAAWHRFAVWGRLLMVALVATGIWRVTTIPKAVDYALYDLAGMTGRLDRRTYLSRFGESGGDQKYSALAVHDLAQYLRDETQRDDRVLLFGFSPGALAFGDRQSASRFFWSRPVIVGFNEDEPGYGVSGLLEDLARSRPILVVLQRNDWQDSLDSATFFLGNPRLSAWLTRGYTKVGEQNNFIIWRRTTS
jgi:hypothetical protein